MGSDNRNIILIGYRGCGKTTVGTILSRELGRPFVDMDLVIEGKYGLCLAEVIERFGWEHFRKEEKAQILRFSQRLGLVVATGGGVVLDPENVCLLRASGWVFLLWASPEEIVKRLAADPQPSRRPPLKGSLLEEVHEVLREREAKYREAAHFVVESSGRSPEEVAREILRRLKEVRFRWVTPLGSSSG